MVLELHPQENVAGRGKGRHGLVLGLLIAIPLWACIGIAFILLFQDRPITEAESAALMIAAACELVLLRHALRTSDATALRRELLSRSALTARRAGLTPLIAKQALALGALVATYLHYYFWEVQLQIASLNSVTVFVPVTLAG